MHLNKINKIRKWINCHFCSLFMLNGLGPALFFNNIQTRAWAFPANALTLSLILTHSLNSLHVWVSKCHNFRRISFSPNSSWFSRTKKGFICKHQINLSNGICVSHVNWSAGGASESRQNIVSVQKPRISQGFTAQFTNGLRTYNFKQSRVIIQSNNNSNNNISTGIFTIDFSVFVRRSMACYPSPSSC